jgi:hypothetical protein
VFQQTGSPRRTKGEPKDLRLLFRKSISATKSHSLSVLGCCRQLAILPRQIGGPKPT